MERIESFVAGLPGYSGYRDKESRRDSDRRLRKSIANQLGSIAQRLERGGAALAQQRQLDKASGVEQLVRSLNHAADRVRTQSYGYGGIFSDTPVEERALAQLLLFDRGLAVKVDQLDAQLAGIESEMVSGESIADMLQEAEKSVQSLLAQVDTRGAVLETASAAPQRSLFEPFAGSETAKPGQAVSIDVGIGDAISHFDDDYIIDALIEVNDGDIRVQFLRVQSNPSRWLAIADYGEQVLALLEEADPAKGPVSSSAGSADERTVGWRLSGPGKVVETSEKLFKADASVTYYEHQGRPQDVSFRVLSGEDERYLSGKRVHPDDLSVFGKPAKR